MAHNSLKSDCKSIIILYHFYSLFCVVFDKLPYVRLFLKLNGDTLNYIYNKLLKLNG